MSALIIVTVPHVRDGGYRDPRVGVLSRITDADLAIADCDARTTPALAAMLPEALAADLVRLRAEPPAADDSITELTRVADAHEALADALRSAIALAPELESHLQAPDEMPRAPPQEDMWGPVGTEVAILPTLASARKIASSIDPNADVTCAGARITARLHVRGIAVLWCVELGMYLNNGASMNPIVKFLSAKHVLEMRVSDDLPRLAIRPETWGDALLAKVGLHQDFKTGDADFDRTFYVEGTAAFARPLLNAKTRAALKACASISSHTLLLEKGLSVLRFREGLLRAELDEKMPKAAAKALHRLQQSAQSLPLLKPV